MSEQEKYDELIRQKFAEKEFIFNEENWEKAEKMLDSSKRSRKIVGWSLVFLIGMITGSFLMFFLTKEPQHSTKPDSHVVLKNTQPAEEITTPVNKTESSTGDQKNNSHTSGQTTGSAVENEKGSATTSSELENAAYSPVNEHGNTKTDKMIASSEMKNRRSSEKLTNEEQLVDENTRAVRTASKKSKQKTNTLSEKELVVGTTKKIKNKKSNESGETTEGKATSESSGTDQVTRATKKLKTKNSSTGKKAVAEIEETATLALNKTKKSSEKNTGEKVRDATSEQVKEAGNATEAENVPADSSAQLTVTNKTVDDTASADSVKQKEIALVTADSTLPKTDSVVAPAIAKENVVAPSLPMDGLATTTIFSLDAGAHAQLGWQYSDTVEGRGVTPVAGISLTHYFNQKWSASLGVQYSCIAYLKASTRSITNTTYSFGAVTTSTTVKPGILNYVNVPFFVQYHFNNANAVLIGGTGGVLLNKKSAVEMYTSYVTPDLINPTYKTYYQNYYKHSFNSFDASFCVGYRRRISSHFNLAAIVNYGMRDLKKDTFFLRNAVERNSGLKLILSYNLFDF